MHPKRSHRLHLVSENRAKFTPRRGGPPPRRPDDELAAFAGKIDLAAQVVAAIGAEASARGLALPARVGPRLANIEAQLEILAHEILTTEARADG